jgi:hypothetical protein
MHGKGLAAEDSTTVSLRVSVQLTTYDAREKEVSTSLAISVLKARNTTPQHFEEINCTTDKKACGKK